MVLVQDNVPISATWMRTIDNDKLLYGDDNGYLHVLNFTDEWGGENPKVAPGVAEYLLPGMSEDEPWLIHSSWVTRLLYLTHSCTLMTGSMDGYLMMLDIEKQRKKWSAKEHHHGICAFAYGRSLNFIASCGLERHINIWNPFTARIMGTLTGHQAPVVDVVVNDKENQVISVASDSLIKIWDMRTHRCLQTIIERSNPKSLDPPILNRIFYDQSKNMLLAGGSVLEAWKHKGSSESKVKKICAVLYSPIFQQIVIGEETDSTVTIWDIETGGKLFSFSDTIKKTKMSAMSFDFSGRRLIIGGQQGRLSMWNFNNGQFLKEFKGFGQNEVSCVACLEEGKMKFVAAGGWNGKVCIWGDGSKEHEFVEHSTRGHSDDVICMTFFPPNCFATGSYDGKVIIWKVDGMIRCILQTSNSGQKEEFSDPITSLLNFPQEKVIAGVSAHGYLYFWRVPEPKTIFEASLGHSTQPGPICLDSNNQVLFTSDIKGYVKAWTMKDMRFQEEYEDSKMSELFCFRAHHETIVSMIFIDEKKLLLTASVFFTCRLWTDTGVKIGQFGQSDPWNLDLPDTWSSSTPTYVASIAISRDSSDSISSPHSSSRISTSAGTSGDHSANNQQMSRGNSATAPLEGSGEAKDQSREHSNDELVKQNDVRDADTESAQYPYSVISQILDNGPPHLQLNSWFRPLQIAYNRKLPIKILVPFGAVIPSNVSHVRKKGHRESVTTVTPTINRKKSRVQDSPPRLSLPRFRFNSTAMTFTTMKTETSSGKSLTSIDEIYR
ncbi:hypothetical protein KP509_22G074700 [Ceratopteris richardii]|uniref:Uncharacterized protein n=1 Tax=Ceratopteris richardii TaxID=49495 RepID=A0A8T2S9C7_CERRI|nr:hypothetical protein KP509_22G074700 [Ceratopteris richardii]KAH7307741.1 hypothetical protein KP509_22G074700 [Ceratopteris richardii]